MSGKISVCLTCGAKNRITANPPGQAPVCGQCRTALPWLVHATDIDFEAEIGAPVPVLVDFWAPWCGPCRVVAPVLEKLARDLAGRLKVVKLNVDESVRVAGAFQISSIPTLKLFVEGRAVETIVGAVPETAILQKIAPHLRH